MLGFFRLRSGATGYADAIKQDPPSTKRGSRNSVVQTFDRRQLHAGRRLVES